MVDRVDLIDTGIRVTAVNLKTLDFSAAFEVLMHAGSFVRLHGLAPAACR